jgi:hypothetical protein
MLICAYESVVWLTQDAIPVFLGAETRQKVTFVVREKGLISRDNRKRWGDN